MPAVSGNKPSEYDAAMETELSATPPPKSGPGAIRHPEQMLAEMFMEGIEIARGEKPVVAVVEPDGQFSVSQNAR